MNSKQQKTGRRLTRWSETRASFIHEQMYHQRYPTRLSLARDLGVSVAVIESDIYAMRTHRSLPIECSRTAGKVGYYYSGPVPEKLGPVTITDEQMLNLIIADRAMAQMPIKQRNRQFDLGLKNISKLTDSRTGKLLNELQGAVYFRPFAPERIDFEVLLIITEAIRNRYVLEVLYTKHMATVPELKQLYPYCFTCAANAWYMIAFDPNAGKSGEFRTYMLSRMKEPVLLDEKFKRQKFDLDEYLEGAFIINKGSGKEWFEVVVEFDAWASAYIRNRQFTANQKIDELPGGGLRISMKLTCLEEVEAWVCYWREHARVISPLPLVERLYEYGKYLVKTCGEVLDAAKRQTSNNEHSTTNIEGAGGKQGS
jgi:predicted DNA-binding transcriptional regulator YafY